jgi:hypothetical protein
MFPSSKDESVYIICSASGVEDKTTTLVRIYNVVAKTQVFKIIPDLNLNFLPRPVPLRMPAVWRRQEDDPVGEEYDFQIVFVFPDRKEHTVGSGKFTFGRSFPDGPVPYLGYDANG